MDRETRSRADGTLIQSETPIRSCSMLHSSQHRAPGTLNMCMNQCIRECETLRNVEDVETDWSEVIPTRIQILVHVHRLLGVVKEVKG